MNEIELLTDKSTLSIVNDPFKKNMITKISVIFFKDISGKFRAIGSIYFTNGKTKGEQEFFGDTFDDIILQMRALINEMK